MSAWTVGILGSIAAAVLIAAFVRLRETWRRFGLRRLAWRYRRHVRARLSRHLGLTAANGPKVTRSLVEDLGSSFRLRPNHPLEKTPTFPTELGAQELLNLVARQSDRIYLVNAESGYGKSVLGMTLSLLPRRSELVPIYVDLGRAKEDQPILEVRQILASLGDAEVAGRPLLILDGLNETVDPVRFCEDLAQLDSHLQERKASLVFLFSFRHRSYPGQLRAALAAHGLGPLTQVELLFDGQCERDLSSFPAILDSKGKDGSFAAALIQDLRHYADRFASKHLSRADLKCFVEWRHTAGGIADKNAESPSPATLRFARVMDPCSGASSAVRAVSGIAFRLLNLETITFRLDEPIGPGNSGGRSARLLVSSSGLDGFVSCDDTHLRFRDEAVVRILAAEWIALSLVNGQSPPELRGRTAYDVCAPYLAAALKRTFERCSDDSSATMIRASAAIRRALTGRDAPYSFYASALCNGGSKVFGEHGADLNARVFEGLIEAIDQDRAETLKGSLKAAGRAVPNPSPDPVLDQLFEVMAAYRRGAVKLLLRTMDDPRPLVRSQAAYLLVDWVNSVALCPDPADREALGLITETMTGEERNLHVRFHLLEIFEALLRRAPSRSHAHALVAGRLSELANGTIGRADLLGPLYADCQRLVSMRARSLADEADPNVTPPLLPHSLRNCLTAIDADPGFLTLGSDEGLEERLECWEVTLAFASRTCCQLPQNAALLAFLESALRHPHWIVRWWSFVGLTQIVAGAGEDQRVLANRCARLVVEQLCCGVEPIGLKHRQSALIRRFLEGDSASSRIIRTALSGTVADHLGPLGRQTLSERYYQEMEASPDLYLSEFFRRIDELVLGAG